MRLRMIALALLLSLLLSGCAGLLDRSYSAVTPHSQFSDEDKNANNLRAGTYQGLVSALFFLISNGAESGVVRLYDYNGPAEQDVDAACLEVTGQDPLGAYAVDYMKYDMARVTDYYELHLTLVYKRSWQQISSVSSVTGSSAVLGELRAALLDFQKEKVLRVSYFDPDMTEQSVLSMVEEAYYDVPESSFGRPEVTVQLYPEKAVSQQRLVEILLDYPEKRETLKEKQKELLKRSEDLVRPFGIDSASVSASDKLDGVIAIFKEDIALRMDGEASAYAALLGGGANAEGLTLAAELLLQKSGLQCRIVSGTKNGTPRLWTVVQMDDVWQHLDITAQNPCPLGDHAIQGDGYRWSGDIPSCQDLPLLEQ